MTIARGRDKLKEVPPAPGVYLFYDQEGRILYIGKARNLRHRVPSYFSHSNLDRGPRMASLVDNIADISWTVTDSEIEALLLEARLIQKYKPKYNIEWRDDKSYLHVEIDLKADLPTIRLVRKGEVGRNKKAKYFGPYTSPRALKLALRFIRRLLPYCEYSFAKGKQATRKLLLANRSTSREWRVASSWFSKPCLYYHLGLCPGVCAGKMSLQDYQGRVRQIVQFFAGRKDRVIFQMEKEMKRLARAEQYEEAVRVRDRWKVLNHLKDISLVRGAFEEGMMTYRGAFPHRIEAYDASNILGKFAVGVMIVFIDGQPAKNEYKRFRIKTVEGISDVGALIEVLRRRMRHSVLANSKQRPATRKTDRGLPFAGRDEWTLPNLIMVDGGKAQLNAAVKVLTEFGAQIPVLAVAKGKRRKRADQYWYGPHLLSDEKLIRRVRDEAHRFAISYYRILHRKRIILN